MKSLQRHFIGKRVFFLSFLFFAIVAVTTNVTAAKPSGVYAVIEGRPAQTQGESINVELFSSFYCGHCYNFFLNEDTLEKRHSINIIHHPIQWGSTSTKATEAYLIAREMGKGKEMRRILFNSFFKEQKDISDLSFLKATAKSLGLGKKFEQQLISGEKAQEISANLDLAKSLRINSTPSAVIAGNLVVVPNMTGGNMNVFVMNIDTILGSLQKKSSH